MYATRAPDRRVRVRARRERDTDAVRDHDDILAAGDGFTLRARVSGTGPLVALIPSLGRTAADFDRLADDLVAAGFAPLQIEPRGLDGAGLDGAGLAGTVTLHDLAADAAALVDATGRGPAHVVGHALGNRIARCLAADRPDLVRSLTLLAAGGLVPPAEDVFRALLACFDESLDDDAHLEAVRVAFFAEGNDPVVWREGWHPAIAAAQGAAVRATPRDDWWLARAGRVLVVQGLQDQTAVPANGRRYVEELRADGIDARLVEIDGAGHALIVEQPDQVADAVIEFLAASPSADP